MEFNTLTKICVFPILQKYGFEIIEELKNILRFQSSIIKINIVHNSFENSNTLWIGKREKVDMIEIDDNVLINFFNSSLKIDKVSVQTFINNLVIFFENEGESLLKGNQIDDLERFDLEKNRNYTLNLLYQQDLQVAEEAWQENNYKKFVTIIDKLDYENLPKSYLLKYKIAKQKI